MGENLIINKDKKKLMKNMIGYNFRMTEIDAAIGLAQLKKLKLTINKKKKSQKNK